MLKRITNYLKNNQINCKANKSSVLDYLDTHSLNAYTNCISNFNIHNRLFALTSFARQSLASLYRKSAFTLAETLIVMGIIGVVAALTLPNLNSSTGYKEKIAKFKKIRANLEDAIGRAQAVYGPLDEWCTNYSGSCVSRHFDRITEFLKVSKICNSVSQCHILINENGSDGEVVFSYSAILSDGSTIGLRPYLFANNSSGFFYIDLDGPNKGQNKGGHDCFLLEYDKNGISSPCNKKSGTIPFFSGCRAYNTYEVSQWVIEFDNMDYLKTSDGTSCPNSSIKLTFDGSHSCK